MPLRLARKLFSFMNIEENHQNGRKAAIIPLLCLHVMRDLRPSACPTPEIHILRLVQSPGSLSSNILRFFLPVGKDFTNQAANFLPVGKPFFGPPAWKTKGPAVADAGWRE